MRQLKLIRPASKADVSSVAAICSPAISSIQRPSDCSTARVGAGLGFSRRCSASKTTSRLKAHCNIESRPLSQIEMKASTNASTSKTGAIREGRGSSVREGADRIDQGSQLGIGTDGVGEKPALQVAVLACEQALENG